MQKDVARTLEGTTEAALRPMRDRIHGHANARARQNTNLSALSLLLYDAPMEPSACLYDPRVMLIVQGRMRVVQGGEVYEYGAGQVLLASVDLPALFQVLDASTDRPFLALILRFDPTGIGRLIADAGLPSPRNGPPRRGIAVTDASPELIDGLSRMLSLLDHPEDVPILAPLVEREVLYRLLMGELGENLRQVGSAGSLGHRIARAVTHVKGHYREALRVADLAASVGMSTSTFHRHFRALTGMTPLQYQKWLRLDEAQRLMVDEGADAATAGFRVGYESPSQFSYEYRRRFGAPPAKHVSSLT